MSAWQRTTRTHWLRGIKAYGGPPPVAFVVDLWWPISDPHPTKEWWR